MSPLTEPTKLTLAKGQPVPNDPYLYTNTVLLLHGNGANGSTNIVDSSRVAGSPKIVTPVGNAQISTAVADPFGNSTRGVLAFDGNGDYLTIPANSDFQLLSTNFTLEGWFYMTASQNNYNLISNYQTAPNRGYLVRLTPTAFRLFYSGPADAGYAIDASFGFAANQWYHWAVTKSGSTGYMFINGSLVGSSFAFNPVLDSTTEAMQVGRTHTTTQDFPGYIDELRITKGVARYTSNFTPPTAPFPDF